VREVRREREGRREVRRERKAHDSKANLGHTVVAAEPLY
jgi:hypothetical protein